jgi:hypothetical protein
MSKLILLGVFAILATGCGAARVYEGPARTSAEVAVVHDDRRFYPLITRNVHVVSVDGEEHFRWSFKIEMLPGTHTLGIRFTDYMFGIARWAKSLCFIKFNAEAGHEYQIDSAIGGDAWRVWLVDQQTGARCDCLYEQKDKDPTSDRPNGT